MNKEDYKRLINILLKNNKNISLKCITNILKIINMDYTLYDIYILLNAIIKYNNMTLFYEIINKHNLNKYKNNIIKKSAKYGRLDIFILFNKNVDDDIINLCLINAIENNHIEIVKILLNHPKINFDNDEIILNAAYNNHVKIVKLLLKHLKISEYVLEHLLYINNPEINKLIKN